MGKSTELSDVDIAEPTSRRFRGGISAASALFAKRCLLDQPKDKLRESKAIEGRKVNQQIQSDETNEEDEEQKNRGPPQARRGEEGEKRRGGNGGGPVMGLVSGGIERRGVK